MAAPVPSGRFLLRIPPDLHQSLRARAADDGRSLNQFCRTALEAAAGARTAVGPASGAAAAEVIAGEFGRRLEAVVLFGSRARGDAGPWSDVDLLIVLARDAPVTRALYRTWDAALAEEPAVRGLGPNVNPHFAHLPGGAAGSAPDGGGALWLEVALHGIILWQRTWAVSRWLGDARQRMAEGAIRRHHAHGQPYWSYRTGDAQS